MDWKRYEPRLLQEIYLSSQKSQLNSWAPIEAVRLDVTFNGPRNQVADAPALGDPPANVMAGDFFGTVENVVEVLGAILVAADFGFVPNAKILTSLGGPILITEEDHLNGRAQESPTL